MANKDFHKIKKSPTDSTICKEETTLPTFNPLKLIKNLPGILSPDKCTIFFFSSDQLHC